ncbi:PepSY domain-containing protein [Chitinophaga silvatica]|uniref:PepSY domain-containing protein n=1 Tax=Chitinophaga silvatica TaxID=2282649 RepID=A0A3E1YI91_9BACT|nr:PepSY-associated TM helix domain-containing protein [Chitinophaga silvatica]RFS26960.1 PepSY domain-containing protein [Chitinophaga silvatica]
MNVKKSILQLHRWLGLLSGLVVFVIAITGCLYAFIDELKPICYKERMYVTVPSHGQRLPIDQLRAIAQKAVGETYPLKAVEIPLAADRSIYFRAVKVDPEAIGHANYTKYYWRVFIDPYTGKVLKIEDTKWEFFNVVVNLHINLLLGTKIGKPIVNWSVVIFVVMLVSGLILWWPSNKAAAKQRFAFKWKDSTKWKRKNYDLHNILGFYSLLVLLIISLTGLVIAFSWFDNSVQWLANKGKSATPVAPVFSDTTNTTAFSLDHMLAAAERQSPAANLFFISIPADNKSPVHSFSRNDKKPLYLADRVQLDQHTGATLKVKDWASLNNGESIRAMNYDLHVGSVLGIPGKILAFLASLIAASLPVTGFYIWWGRSNKKKVPVRAKAVMVN